MAKRRQDEATVESDAKRRKQSLISSDNANPVGSDGTSQCFRKVTVRMHVFIAPQFVDNPIEGIKKQHFEPLLLNYFDDVKGVVIAYTNVKLFKPKNASSGLAIIKGESPFSYTWVSADMLVWNPKVGDTLEGWVSVQSPGHIALLIHDMFNATIKRVEIPQTWEFISQDDDEAGDKSLGYWQDANGQRIDGKLQFTVKRFNHGGKTVLVMGSLLTRDDVQPPQMNNISTDSKSNSKHMKFGEDEPEPEPESVAGSKESTKEESKQDKKSTGEESASNPGKSEKKSNKSEKASAPAEPDSESEESSESSESSSDSDSDSESEESSSSSDSGSDSDSDSDSS